MGKAKGSSPKKFQSGSFQFKPRLLYNARTMTQTVVITGANRGIGLAMCKDWLGRGASVLATCRRASEGLLKLQQSHQKLEILESMDVTQNQACESLTQKLRAWEGEAKVDILVNCAGVMTADRLEQLELADLEKQFQVNALGPLRVTKAVLPFLSQGSKIAMISSRMGSIGDNHSGAYYGYRMSKSALNSASKSMARDLKPKGIAVGIFHPGYVRTDMTGQQGQIEPEQSAAALIERIAELSLENAGQFVHAQGEILPW